MSMYYVCINGLALALSASKRIWKQKRNYFISHKCHCHCSEYIPNATDRHINSHSHTQTRTRTHLRIRMHAKWWDEWGRERERSEKEGQVNTRSITLNKNVGTVFLSIAQRIVISFASSNNGNDNHYIRKWQYKKSNIKLNPSLTQTLNEISVLRLKAKCNMTVNSERLKH